MSQKIGTPIDLTGNVIKNAGIEVVSSLPTTFLVEGREIIFQGEVFRYLNGEWRINSFSAYSLKTYAELRELKDSNALVTGSQYVLTDFYTTFLAEDGETWLGSSDCEVIDHLGNPIVSDNYHILLQATSENTFSPQAHILNQPDSEKLYLRRISDWIIYFDFNQDLFGRITYMYDTRYNCTYDFDIYNIRWRWKGYEINFALKSSDFNLIGEIGPNNDYYLWTIGDIKCCNETNFDINQIYSPFPYGVMDNTILDSSRLFFYVHSKTKLTTAYYNAIFRNCTISYSDNIVSSATTHSITVKFSSNFYNSGGAERFSMYNASNIFYSGSARGINIGYQETHGTVSYYLFFGYAGAAYVDTYIKVGRYSTFLSNTQSFSIDLRKTPDYPVIRNTALLNKASSVSGGVVGSFEFNDIENTEITIPAKSNFYFYIRSLLLKNKKFELPDVDIMNYNIPYKFFDNGENLYLHYLNSENENISSLLDATEITESVVFYEDYIKTTNKMYFMPFCAFVENPTEWGFEIEATKYKTSEILPILACVFMNTGSIKTDFAGKTLKFYVDMNNSTYYSNSYNINSNGTLTKVS